MDRLVGALHVDAAKLAHQQTGDQRGNHVGHRVGHHQQDHHPEADKGVNGLAARWRHLVYLGRQPHQQKVTAVGLQQSDMTPVAHHQQGIPHLQRLIHQLATHRLAIPAQPHHAQAVAGAEGHLAHGFAKQARLGNKRHLGHPHLPRLIGEVLAAQDHRLKARLAAKLANVDFRIGHIDQQHIPGLKFTDPRDRHHHPTKLAPALYPDDVGAIAGAQLQLIQGMANQR